MRCRPLDWLTPLFLTAATLALLVPFLNKPFHIDDPMYVWAAQHITAHPMDPYGFVVNWSSVPLPMSVEMKNPPLICYYLAGAALLVGWSEMALHAVMLLPAIGTILGIYFLALELSPPGRGETIARAALAALVALLTPLFLVSASTIMSDVPMLCCYVWSTWFWARGLRTGRNWALLAGAILIAAASLTKYFGITLFPLLFAYGLLARRRIGTWALWLLVPAGMLLAFELWTRRLYGHGLLLEAMIYSGGKQTVIGDPLLARLIAAFSFTGGGAITFVLLMLAWARRGTMLAWSALALAVLVMLALADPFPTHRLHDEAGRLAVGYWVQLTCFTAAGVALVASALGAGWLNRRNPGVVILALWILGTFVFSSILNWSVNGRSVLPLVPPGAILVSQWLPIGHLDPLADMRWPRIAIPLVLGGMISIWCGIADASHARAARQAADFIHRKYAQRPGQIWFIGHWGFQYYMEKLGARPINLADPFSIREHDLIIVPINNSYHFLYRGRQPGNLPVIDRGDVRVFPYLALMQSQLEAGFYTDMWGPLPFAFGSVPADLYLVQEVRGPIEMIPR